MAHPSEDAAAGRGRLTVRPSEPGGERLDAGMHELGLGEDRDGLIHVPRAAAQGRPCPLVLLLHGAGSTARLGLRPLLDHADRTGVVLVAPDSRGATWDVILGGFGPDVRFIDRCLAAAFDRVAVDPHRLAVGGFSDGASYALSLGVTNGDLFGAVLAFSPGFLAAVESHGRPWVFVSHGRRDSVLPIDGCSRRLVPALRNAGFEVDYHEFDGGHVVPDELALAALDRFLADGRGASRRDGQTG